MSIQKIPKSYSLPVASVREVEILSKKKGVSNSEIVAQALDFYLGHRSIEGTFRSEMAKVDLILGAIKKDLAIAIDQDAAIFRFAASADSRLKAIEEKIKGEKQ